MKKNKIVCLILIVIGLISLIVGVIFLSKNKQETGDEFMMNTIQSFTGITCYKNLCLDNLVIYNSSTKDTELEFDLTNNNKTMVMASKLRLRFDTGDKIPFSYNNLEPNKTIKIKVKTKSNLSEVMSYKLEKN